MTARDRARAARVSATVFIRDVGQGLLEVSHNTLALLGLGVVAVLAFAASRPDMRHQAERAAYDWLQTRQVVKEDQRQADAATATAASTAAAVATPPSPDAAPRASAAEPKALTRPQAAVTQWLSRRYRVAPEPVSRLVQEAWQVGQRVGLDPTLILAIMAVESSFNPFAQSAVGAQGLMQVMTRVHDAKYDAFGGTRAALDPVANLRVGVQVLKECIGRAGGLEAGLRHYVGSANVTDDNGYAGKVLAEQSNLLRVASGKAVPATTPLSVPAATAAPVAAPPAVTAAPPPLRMQDSETPPAAVPAAPEAADDASTAAGRVALLR